MQTPARRNAGPRSGADRHTPQGGTGLDVRREGHREDLVVQELLRDPCVRERDRLARASRGPSPGHERRLQSLPGRIQHALDRRNLRERFHLRGKNRRDRKSTRLNSSHLGISYAVFCLKKKKKKKKKD